MRQFLYWRDSDQCGLFPVSRMYCVSRGPAYVKVGIMDDSLFFFLAN